MKLRTFSDDEISNIRQRYSKGENISSIAKSMRSSSARIKEFIADLFSFSEGKKFLTKEDVFPELSELLLRTSKLEKGDNKHDVDIRSLELTLNSLLERFTKLERRAK